jgi:phospholipid/cholesterol/gamma-HCH transport system substrate-binding protein
MSTEVKVGIFVFIALIVLGVLVIGVADIGFVRQGYSFNIIFSSAAGLEQGAPVRVAGIQVGKVDNLELIKNEEGVPMVKVKAWVRDGTSIPKDSTASITISNLLSERYVEIFPGKDYSKLVEDGDTIEGKPTMDFSTLFSDTGGIVDDVKEALKGIKSITNEESAKSLRRTVRNVDEITTNINDVVANRKDDIDNTLYRVNMISTRIDELLEKNENELDLTIKNLQTVTANLEETTNNINSITEKIDKGQGTVGKLINDPSLYDELLATTKDARVLINDFQNKPTKYLNLSIF